MISAAHGAADDAALAALEFPAVIDLISDRATCQPGKAACLRLRPLPDVVAASAEQHLIDDAVAFFQAGGDIGFGGVADSAEALARARVGATLSGPDLRCIAAAEHALSKAVALLLGVRKQDEPLAALAATRADTGRLVRRIDGAVDDDGSVIDSASPQLAKIRRSQKALHDEVRERCTAIVRNPSTAKLLSEPVVTVRAGRYVVPVRTEFAAQFAGVVHDESASGATVYIEPLACVEPNNRLRALEAAEEREVARILGELSAEVGEQADVLAANATLIARLDSVGARARWAIAVRATRPALAEDQIVRIVRGRHPLLRREPVPLDVELGQDFDVLVISGPNMGGKSVALKTIGLFCLLAYTGIPLPAGAGTQIGWYDHIASVVGDEQSIAQDLSSFSAHLQALHAAARRAGPRSLVLVDEIGGGTEPSAGAALARAFIESLMRRGAQVAITTHFTQLKIFAAETARVANASMLFDLQTSAPTFVLALGIPGQSFAFSLARTLGLDARMIERAEQLHGSEAKSLERTFAALAAQQATLRAKETEFDGDRARLREAQAEVNKKIGELEAQRRAFEVRATAMLDRAAQSVREELIKRAEAAGQTTRRRLGREVADADKLLAQTLVEMRRSLGLERAPGAPAPSLAVGDVVFVPRFEREGVVSELYDRDALVTMGTMKAVVPKAELEKAAPSGPQSDSGAGRTKGRPLQVEERAMAVTSVDVRGLRVDEATPIIDKALDDAALAGLDQLRIIHGKGTGQLGRGIKEFLRGHPHVRELAVAGDREGGLGVTIVTLG